MNIIIFYLFFPRSTSVSSPGETMPRSDSADSQSQAIQEEPLPSTSNEEDDPLAGWYFSLELCQNLSHASILEKGQDTLTHWQSKANQANDSS